MPAAIFQGPSVKILKNTLKFFGGSKITYKGSVDPTAVATDGSAGDIYVQNGSSVIYVKQDSGSTTNWKPILVDGNGGPLQFAGFDVDGNLTSIPSWSFDPTNYYGVQNSITLDPPDINQYNVINRHSDSIQPSVDSPNFTTVMTQMGTDLDPTNSGFQLGFGGLAARTLDMFFTARTESAHGAINSINNNMFLGDAALTGGSVQGAILYDGSLVVETGFTTGGIDLHRMNFEGRLGSVVNGINGISANIQVAGELNNYVNYFLASGTMSPTNAFPNGIGVFQSQPQFYGDIQNINTFVDGASIYGTVNGYTALNMGPSFNSGSSVTGGFTAGNFSGNFDTGSVVSNYLGINVGPNFQSGSTVNNLNMVNLTPGTTGATITNASALNINMQNVVLTSGLPATAINSQGLHNFNANFTPPAGYTGFFQNNYMGSLLTIEAGAPLSNTYGFMDNLAGSVVFNDDIGADPSGFGLGISVVGYVGQIAGDVGKTVHTINFAAAGASVPAAGPGIPSGGTVTNINLYNALGILPAGGSLTIDNLIAYKVGPLFTALSPTNAWGVKVEDTNADNYFAKNVVIGGATAKPVATESLSVTGDTLVTGNTNTDTATIASFAANGVVLNNASGDLSSLAGTGSGEVLTWNGTAWVSAAISGTGDVVGPVSSTDNAITRFDGVTGKLIQNSLASIDDSGTITATNLSGTNTGDQTITLTSDVTGSGTGSFATTIAANAVTNAKAAQMAAHTFKGNNTGSTANALDLTATQLTAELDVFVGDTGSGGAKGLVPATVAGDALKFLSGDGTFKTVSGGSAITSLTGDVVATGPGAAAATIQPGVIDNAKVSASAAIAYSKLNLSASIVNADISASAAIAYSKLNLATSIVNADIATAAAIARTKLASGTNYRILANDASGVMSENAAITASRAVASDANGQLVAATTTTTELNFVSGVTSAIQTQLNGKQASGNYITDLTGEVTATGPGSSVATVTNSAVIGKVLTGYTSGAGTVAATDTILQAVQKLNGNTALNQVRSTLTTKGDLYVATGSGVTARMPAGSDGQVLISDSTQTNGLRYGSAGSLTVTAVSSNVTLAANTINLVDTTSARSLTLPATPTLGTIIHIKDVSLNANVNNITIVRAASETIEGVAASFVMASKGQSIQLVSDASLNWWII